jgi:phosphoglycerate dehydrogenase-like enzyme
MRFVCPDGEPQYRDGIQEAMRVLVAAGHDVAIHADGPPGDAATWNARLANADGVFLLLRLPSELLASPHLRVVSFAGTGVARFVDLGAAADRGVTVCNVPSYGANAVAEHALALMLSAARNVVAGDRLIRAGGWRQSAGLELRGARLGVVGVGPIGRRMLQLGTALGMRSAAWTRSPSDARARELGTRFVELDELMATSDFVSVHVAHTAETEHLLSAPLLERLPAHAVLVNTSRGEVIDGGALARLLAAGRIRAAGLDVFDPEPPAADDPLVREPRCVLTPHVAYDTPDATRELFRVTAENLLAFANGTRQNVVIPA